MSRQSLLPIGMLDEKDLQKDKQLISKESNMERIISIECALMFDERDRFYQIIDREDMMEAAQNHDEEEFQNLEIISLHSINIQYDNVPCSMILFRNWSNNFKF